MEKSMSMPLYGLKVFKKYIQPNIHKGSNICFLSYPDIIVSSQMIGRLFNIDYKKLKLREDSNDIIKWHKAFDIVRRIVDTRQLFEYLGYKVTITDIVKARFDEQYLDLNKFLPEIYQDKFQFVFENCMDHCFNIGQAFINVSKMVSIGGYILHLNPLLMINHGFWSMSPTVYYDFYEANGFKVVFYSAFQGIHKINRYYKFNNPYIRLNNIGHDSMQLVIVKKIEQKPVIWPTQRKFQKFPNSKR